MPSSSTVTSSPPATSRIPRPSGPTLAVTAPSVCSLIRSMTSWIVLALAISTVFGSRSPSIELPEPPPAPVKIPRSSAVSASNGPAPITSRSPPPPTASTIENPSPSASMDMTTWPSPSSSSSVALTRERSSWTLVTASDSTSPSSSRIWPRVMSTCVPSVVTIEKSGCPVVSLMRMPSPSFRSASRVSPSIEASCRPRSIAWITPPSPPTRMRKSTTLSRISTPLSSLSVDSRESSSSRLITSPVTTSDATFATMPRSLAVEVPPTSWIERLPLPPEPSSMTMRSPDRDALTPMPVSSLIASMTSVIEDASDRSTIAAFPERSSIRIEPRSTPAPPFRSSRSTSRPSRPFPHSKDIESSPSGSSVLLVNPPDMTWLVETSCFTRNAYWPGIALLPAVANSTPSSLDVALVDRKMSSTRKVDDADLKASSRAFTSSNAALDALSPPIRWKMGVFACASSERSC